MYFLMKYQVELIKENEISGLLGRKMRNRTEFQWRDRKRTEYLELYYTWG